MSVMGFVRDEAFTVAERSGLRIDAATEKAWVAGRIAMMAAVVLGASIALRGTSAYMVVLGLAGGALLNNVGIALILLRGGANAVSIAFFLGFLMNTAILGAGWWIVVRMVAESGQPNDMYLVLFPLLLIGAIRLGWLLGSLYTALWMGWMAWTLLTYYPPDSYAAEQLPLRIIYLTATAVLGMHLVWTVQRTREKGEALKERNRDLQERKARGVLAVSAAIRLPVAAIRDGIDALASSSQRNSHGVSKDESVIELRSRVTHLERIVQEALDYGRLERPDAELPKVATDLNRVITLAKEMVEPLVESKGQWMSVSVASLLPMAPMDSLSIERVVSTLLKNASALSPHDSEIAIRLGRSRGGIAIEVGAAGPLLSGEEREISFDEYQQLVSVMGNTSQEDMLELAIARRIVELHHGAIEGRILPGRGLVMTLTLGQLRSARARSMTASPSIPAANSGKAGTGRDRA